MKIVFHKDFHKTYTSDPAAAEGRLKPAEKKPEAQTEPEKKPEDFLLAVLTKNYFSK